MVGNIDNFVNLLDANSMAVLASPISTPINQTIVSTKQIKAGMLLSQSWLIAFVSTLLLSQGSRNLYSRLSGKVPNFK